MDVCPWKLRDSNLRQRPKEKRFFVIWSLEGGCKKCFFKIESHLDNERPIIPKKYHGNLVGLKTIAKRPNQAKNKQTIRLGIANC